MGRFRDETLLSAVEAAYDGSLASARRIASSRVMLTGVTGTEGLCAATSAGI
jgi:hypothetical protein